MMDTRQAAVSRGKSVACILSLVILISLQLIAFSFTNQSLQQVAVHPERTLTPDEGTTTITEQQCQPLVQPHVGHKTVLVTGGAGFIGSHVAEFLLERGDDVIVVDEMNNYYNVSIKEANLELLGRQEASGRLRIHRRDVGDKAFMQSVFEKERPEWVCHMAARAGVRPSIQDPYVYIHSNIQGTTRLMELAHKYKVKNFVFASSSSVYGGSLSRVFDEAESVDHPISPYAATKKAAELMAHTYHHLFGLNITALRFFTVYGPRGRPGMAPFKFIDRVSRGITIDQYGNGTTSRDYTFISDIVDGIVRALDRPHLFQIINLGKGTGNTLADFISLVEKCTGSTRAKRRMLPQQPGDVPYTCANITKAYCLLGYQPKVSLKEGLRQTVEWYNATYRIALQ